MKNTTAIKFIFENEHGDYIIKTFHGNSFNAIVNCATDYAHEEELFIKLYEKVEFNKIDVVDCLGGHSAIINAML